MVALLFVGVWLVLQAQAKQAPIDPDAYRFEMVLGSRNVMVEQRPGTDGAGAEYHFEGSADLRELGWISGAEFDAVITERMEAWRSLPAIERTLLGFFNITSWFNFIWVAVGLLGQAAFFGRMLAQWIMSEKRGESIVPEAFWWLSLIGGVSLFTYFVWRVDIVGVLGQSTGIVIYARNLRLIRKQRRRQARQAAANPAPIPSPSDDEPALGPEGATHARVAG